MRCEQLKRIDVMYGNCKVAADPEVYVWIFPSLSPVWTRAGSAWELPSAFWIWEFSFQLLS